MSQFDYVQTKREDVAAYPEKWVWLIRGFLKFFTRINVAVFMASKGRLMNKFSGGAPICIVAMTGRKSGKRRRIALIHLPYENSVLLVASQGGMEQHPVWYHNIAANPNIEVTVGGETRKMKARQIDDDEKRKVWPHLLGIYPDFDEYQARTDRNIPVFMCEPV